MMSIADAQRDMRDAYYGGATGAVSSATVWLVAALVVFFASPMNGIATLFFGGMLIVPASGLLCKILGRSGKHDKDNPLGPLAIQGTLWMLFSIPIAYGAALYNDQWFFPSMLVVIGGRYLTFATLYGMKTYWAFGAALGFSGMAIVGLEAPVVVGAGAGALIEYAFGGVIFSQAKARKS